MKVERVESMLEEVENLTRTLTRARTDLRAGDASAEGHIKDAKKTWQAIGDIAGWDSDD